ncbi:MAG: hypothetical protein KBC28_06065 [Alphaproteobacteria bacterium]|jgi:hypothetical protein|nr:hypothetical protein [Alphaproteobacteria bacterium]
MMVKKSIVLMSAFVLGVTLGSEAEAVKKITTASWGPMDEFVTRTPGVKKSKPPIEKSAVSSEDEEKILYVSAMSGSNSKDLTRFQKAYVLKTRGSD